VKLLIAKSPATQNPGLLPLSSTFGNRYARSASLQSTARQVPCRDVLVASLEADRKVTVAVFGQVEHLDSIGKEKKKMSSSQPIAQLDSWRRPKRPFSADNVGSGPFFEGNGINNLYDISLTGVELK